MKSVLIIASCLFLLECAQGAATVTLSALEASKESSNNVARKPEFLDHEKRQPGTKVEPPNATVPWIRVPVSIPGTPITLMIIDLGDRIPAFELGAGLTNALRTIQSSVRTRGSMPIFNHEFWYRDKVSNLWFSLIVASHKVITWQQLSWTLTGLLHWMKNDHCRELAFELELDGEGHVGFGNLGYDPIPTTISSYTGKIQRRTKVSNTTFAGNGTGILQFPSTVECFTIPRMVTEICIRSLGQPIPASAVNAMFTGASAKIQPFLDRDPDQRIPDDIFRYTKVISADRSRISFIFRLDPRATVVWLGLLQILLSLWEYMEGTRPNVPSQQQHFQVLEFDLISFGKAYMGTGYVLYTRGQIPLEFIATS